MGPIRTFVLDDHDVVREGLRMALADAAGIDVVGEGATAREATDAIPRLCPDVAIVDVRLPDGSGIEVARYVRRVVPSVKCVMFTAFAGDETLLKSVIAGAVGYLPKHAAAAEVVTAVRRAAAGESLIDPELLGGLQARELPDVAPNVPLARLTPHERRIVHLVADGCTNREIAQRLDLAEKTVRNYVSSILAKVDARNRTQLAVLVAGFMTGGGL